MEAPSPPYVAKFAMQVRCDSICVKRVRRNQKKRLSPFGRVYEKNWPMAMLKTGVGVTPEVATGERDFLNLVMTYIRHRVTAITTQGTSPLSKSTTVTAPPHIAPAIREAANRKTLLLCGSKLTSCPQSQSPPQCQTARWNRVPSQHLKKLESAISTSK
jgi:hypothetical protein